MAFPQGSLFVLIASQDFETLSHLRLSSEDRVTLKHKRRCSEDVHLRPVRSHSGYLFKRLSSMESLRKPVQHTSNDDDAETAAIFSSFVESGSSRFSSTSSSRSSSRKVTVSSPSANPVAGSRGYGSLGTTNIPPAGQVQSSAVAEGHPSHSVPKHTLSGKQQFPSLLNTHTACVSQTPPPVSRPFSRSCCCGRGGSRRI